MGRTVPVLPLLAPTLDRAAAAPQQGHGEHAERDQHDEPDDAHPRDTVTVHPATAPAPGTSTSRAIGHEPWTDVEKLWRCVTTRGPPSSTTVEVIDMIETRNGHDPGEAAVDRTRSADLPREVDVAVVGGGIAGWTAALTAACGGASVLLIEAHEHGGRARTVERDGFCHNIGPHGLYLAGHLQGLLDRHGLHVAGTRLATQRATLARSGTLHDVVFGPVGLLRTTALRPRDRARVLRLFASLPRLDAAAFVGRSVHEWLGDEPVAVQEFIGTFVRVPTYVHAPDELDAGAAIAQVQQSLRGVRYLDGGWAQLIDTLAGAAAASGVRTVTGVAAQRVLPDAAHGDGAGGVRVETAAGDVRARAVVIAAGGPDVAERLAGTAVNGRDALTAPIAATTLDLALARPHTRLVFGVDEPLYLSPHAPTARLAPPGRGLVCTMRYLAPGEAPGSPDAERARLRAFAGLAGIPAEEVLHEWPLHRSVVSHGAPSASGGGLRGRPAVDALGLPGVLLAGDWVGPHGMLADAAAASGESAAQHALSICASIRG